MSGSIGDNVFRASGVIAAAAAGRTGTVDWQTGSIKTTGFTPTNGEGYFCDTSGGAFAVTLPAGVAGNIVAFSDYTRSFLTYNLTLTPNGSEKIGGVAANAVLEVAGQSATFVYVDGTEGWINIQETSTSQRGTPPFIEATGGTPCSGAISGDYKIHTFTGPGTFCVSKIATCSGDNEVSYMVVGGGGGAAGYYGGAGAGGFRESKSPVDSYTASPIEGSTAVTVSASPYAVVIGAGGAAVAGGTNDGNSGSLASALGISSAGGGFGSGAPGSGAAGSGGSGGGEGYQAAGGAGSGNTPPTSPAQGTDGGTGAPEGGGGGGGGATVAGSNAPAINTGGAGGAGATTSISATPTVYAGGGGAGAAGTGGAGGTGGGGTGQPAQGTGAPAQTGGVNTGGGGGARGDCGSGGSGVVIIRYKWQ
jgi:hypothetical protein